MEYCDNGKEKFLRIKSVADLDKILTRCEEGDDAEFFILLNFGLRSRKEIHKCANGKYSVYNSIDDSRRTVTAEQLQSPAETMIGEAMAKGAFFHVLKCRDCERDADCSNSEHNDCGGCPSLKVSRELIDTFDTKGKARKPCQTRSS